MIHKLFGDLQRKRLIETAIDVDTRQLPQFPLRIVSQFAALTCDVRRFRIRLGTNRHVFAGRHRHGSSHQACDACYDNSIVACRGTGHADHEAGGREKAVVCAENRCSQPAEPRDYVGFGMPE
jgi:hypothetical protein